MDSVVVLVDDVSCATLKKRRFFSPPCYLSAKKAASLVFRESREPHQVCHISNISIAQWRRDYPVVDSCVGGVGVVLRLIANVRAGVQPSHSQTRFAHCSLLGFRLYFVAWKEEEETPTHRYHLIIWYLFGGMFAVLFSIVNMLGWWVARQKAERRAFAGKCLHFWWW